MRIMFACGADLSGPDEKQFRLFARELTARGHAVMMCLRAVHPDAHGVEEADRVLTHTYRLAGRRPRREDDAAVAAFGPDLVHALSPRAGPVAAAAHWARRCRIPLFAHFADDEWGLARGLGDGTLRDRAQRMARRALAPLAPRVWPYATRGSLRRVRRSALGLDAITPALAREVERRLGRECSVVLPIAEPAAAPGDAPYVLPTPFGDRPCVVYTGAIQEVHERDVRLALRAIAGVQRRGSPLHFVHAGLADGRRHPVRLAEEEGLAPGSALALGYLPANAIPALLRAATVLVQPGAPTEFNRLRLPSKLSSYLASGTPVVTYGAGFGELLEDRREVLKTHTDDPAELADRLEEVLSDPLLRETLSEGGPRAAARLLGAERNTEALLEHYERRLAAPRGPSRPAR